MGADIGNDDVLRVEGGAQVPDDLLWFNGKGGVVLILADFFFYDVMELVQGGIGATLGLGGDAGEAVADLANNASFQNVVRVDLGWIFVDVNDLLVAIRVPEARVIFDHVDADADHQIRLVETECDIVMGL